MHGEVHAHVQRVQGVNALVHCMYPANRVHGLMHGLMHGLVHWIMHRDDASADGWMDGCMIPLRMMDAQWDHATTPVAPAAVHVVLLQGLRGKA